MRWRPTARQADALHQRRQTIGRGGGALSPARFGARSVAARGLVRSRLCLWRRCSAYGDGDRGVAPRGRLCVRMPPAPRCNLAEALFQLGEVDAAVARIPRSRPRRRSPSARAIALAHLACIAPGCSSAWTTRRSVVLREQVGRHRSARDIRPVEPQPAQAGAQAAHRLSQCVLRRAQLDEDVHGA